MVTSRRGYTATVRACAWPRRLALGALLSAGACRALTGLDDLSHDDGPGAGGSTCSCDLANADTQCADDGSCELLTCQSGFLSCDGDDESGCETPISADPDNCGACDRGCLGAACVAGRCQPVVLAENVGNPTVLVLHGDWVYYVTDQGDDSVIGRVPRSPSDGLPTPPEPIVVEPNPTAHGLVTDDTSLIWGSRSSNEMRRVPLDGGASELLFTANDPWDIKRDGDVLYWTERVPGNLRRANAEVGATIETLASGLSRPFELILDDTHVYWTDQDDSTLNRILHDGAGLELAIATTPRDDVSGMGLAQSSDAVFWTGSTPSIAGDVLRYDKRSGEATTFVEGDVTRSVAVDDTHVYWVDKLNNAVLRRPLAGGSDETLVEFQLSPQGIVVDDEAVYWANFSGASIVKVAK